MGSEDALESLTLMDAGTSSCYSTMVQLPDDIEESENLGFDLLEDLDLYWDGIKDWLTISQMVSDSVIKGMVSAVEQEAAEKMAQKDLELTRLKEALHLYHVGADDDESICSGICQQQNRVIISMDCLPLVSAWKASAEKDTASFHFPGHNRGHAAPSSLTEIIGIRPFFYDIPVVPELDSLFAPKGPILEAQKQAAKLFGSSETWFLVGGTTCGIQAAIMATCSPGEHIILPRNSHLSAISALVLSGAIPKYIIPEYDCKWDIAGGISPLQVRNAVEELEMEGRKPAAVFITSPTYHGICSDLSEITQLCHAYGIPVIVDEAHGAHLGFHSQMPHSAQQQGTDLVVQSTHKVLCSLTQSSMLHLSGNIVDRKRICQCLQSLQSTSPSYLLLASLDAARAQLAENPETIFNKAMELAIEAKSLIKKIPGIDVLDLGSFANFPAIDPLRLTIGFYSLGVSGYEANKMLYEDYGIIPELVGTWSITFVINLGTRREHLQRLVSGLKKLSMASLHSGTPEKRLESGELAPFDNICITLNPRVAFFANKRSVSITESLGKVCGELISPFPPGIPVLIPGEVITEPALNYLLDVKRRGALINGASDPHLSSIIICDV